MSCDSSMFYILEHRTQLFKGVQSQFDRFEPLITKKSAKSLTADNSLFDGYLMPSQLIIKETSISFEHEPFHNASILDFKIENSTCLISSLLRT